MKKKTRNIVIVATLVVIVLTLLSFVSFLEMTALSQNCKTGATSTSPGFGIQVTASGCVSAPFLESDADKYFTDGDKIKLDCSFSGNTYEGYSYVSTSSQPFTCEPYCPGSCTSWDYSRSVICGPSIGISGTNPLVGGVYDLKPTDTSVKAVCTGYARYGTGHAGGDNFFGSTVAWYFGSLKYYRNTPSITCNEDSIVLSNTGIGPSSILGDFKVSSICDGTAVADLGVSDVSIGLGQSKETGFRTNGDGNCEITITSKTSGEKDVCAIGVVGFKEVIPEPERISDFEDSSEKRPAIIAITIYFLILSQIAITIYFIARRNKK